MKTEIIKLEEINGSQIVNVSEWKQKQDKIVKDNPFVEIIDNATYTQAKSNRTALLKGKTNLLGTNGQEGLIKKHFKNVVTTSSEILQELANITIPKYDLQQAEVKKYEEKKEIEKQAKAKLEQERIEAIKELIEAKYINWKEDIKGYSLEEFNESTNIIEMLADVDTKQFEEYTDLWNEKTRLLVTLFNETKQNLVKKEEQLIEAERLAEEKKKFEEEKALFEKQKAESDKIESDKKLIESDKLAKEKAEFEAEKEKTRKIEREKQSKIDAENKIKQDKLDEQQKELDAKNKIAEDIEQQRLLREQKETEKQEAVKQKKISEKQEKERLKRIEELKPEKEKLLNYINDISTPETDLEFKDKECRTFIEMIGNELDALKQEFIEGVNKI